MENQNSTGAAFSTTLPPNLKVDDLGAIPNLLDKLDVEKIVVQCKTWHEVAKKLVDTKLYQRISGHVIGRILLLAQVEAYREKKESNLPPNPFEREGKRGKD